MEYKTVEEYANDVKKIADSYDNITIKAENFNGDYTPIDEKTGNVKASSKVIFNIYKKGQKIRLEQKFISKSKEKENTWITDEYHFLFDGKKSYLVYGKNFPEFLDKFVDIEVSEMKNDYDFHYNWYKIASSVNSNLKRITEPKILGKTTRNGFDCRLIDMGNFEYINKNNTISANKNYVCVNEQYGLAVDTMWIETSNNETPKRHIYKIKEINTDKIPDEKFKLAMKVLYSDKSKNEIKFDIKYEEKKGIKVKGSF